MGWPAFGCESCRPEVSELLAEKLVMKNEASVEINAGIEEVFDYTTTKVAEWSSIVVEDEVIEEVAGGVGTRFRCVTEEHGKRMEFDGLVTVNDRPRAHTAELVGKFFDIEAAYSFEDLDSRRTRLTQKSQVTGKGLFKLMLWAMSLLPSKKACEAGEKELGRLAELIESGAGAGDSASGSGEASEESAS